MDGLFLKLYFILALYNFIDARCGRRGARRGSDENAGKEEDDDLIHDIKNAAAQEITKIDANAEMKSVRVEQRMRGDTDNEGNKR